MHRTFRALALAIVATLAFAPAAFAASGTETVTVNSNLALVLSRSTISYGAVDPGAQSAALAADRTVVATVSGNGGWTVYVTGSAFTGPGGGLPASIRTAKVDGGTWGNLPFDIGGTGAGGFSAEYQVAIPGTAAAGSYSGEIVYTLQGA